MCPSRRSSSSTLPASPRPAVKHVNSDLSALFDAWETPTLPPPFDLEVFARDVSGLGDERNVASERPTDPAPEDPSESSTRLRTRPPSVRTDRDLRDLRAALTDKFFGGDHAGALAIAEELVSRRPDDSSANDFADECRRMIEKGYLERIGGSVARVLRLAVSIQELHRHALNHRAGFLVSRVDGQSSIDALLDVGAMPRLEALGIIAELLESGVLELVDAP
jgi:hypothetical protein